MFFWALPDFLAALPLVLGGMTACLLSHEVFLINF
jgi:hypothetical protein